MSSIGTGYDLSVTTYSPDGRLFQIEYAGKAVDNSGTVIGMTCKDGVVLGVEKLVETKMMEPGTNQRIFNIDRHVGMAVCGWKPDTRILVNKARKEARDYLSFYGSRIPGHVLNERVSSQVHLFTTRWSLRPFGCSVLMATYNENESPQLFMVEPSGQSFGYHACAIGKGKQASRTELEKIKFSEMTCRQAAREIARIIRSVHDPVKDKEYELELSWVCDESKREHTRVPKDVYDDAVNYADEANREEESDEEDEEMLGDVDE